MYNQGTRFFSVRPKAKLRPHPHYVSHSWAQSQTSPADSPAALSKGFQVSPPTQEGWFMKPNVSKV